MGSRGRNRDGHYLSLLHALELQYLFESQEKGDWPLAWRPSPRNRPDQFLHWILSVLSPFHTHSPTLGVLLEHLQNLNLSRLAQVLQATLTRRVAREHPDTPESLLNAPLDDLLNTIGRSTTAAEAHPQARKVAATLSAQLDARWAAATEATMKEVGERLPPAAQLLGGLPPGFRTINDFIYAQIDDLYGSAVEDLAIPAFYALVTGKLPRLGGSLGETAESLQELRENDVTELRSLKTSQVAKLRTLTSGAISLLGLFPDPIKSASLLDAVARTSPATLDEQLSLMSEARRHRGSQAARPPGIRELRRGEGWPYGAEELKQTWHTLRDGALEQIRTLDRDTLRRLELQEISNKLLRALKTWDETKTLTVERHLQQDWWVIESYLTGRQEFEELKKRRTAAFLSLNGIFPRSISILDKYFAENATAILAEEVEDVTTVALAFSARVFANASSREHPAPPT